MDESILITVKTICEIDASNPDFDLQIIGLINSIFVRLFQMGVGISVFTVTDESDSWSDFMPVDNGSLGLIKTYVGYRVKQIFDPPSSSGVKDAYKATTDELEWNIRVMNGDF